MKTVSVCMLVEKWSEKDGETVMLQSPFVPVLSKMRTEVLKAFKKSFLFPLLAQPSYLTSH